MGCRRKIHDKSVAVLIGQHRPRSRAFGPDDQLTRRIHRQQRFGQLSELIENLRGGSRIELYFLRNVRLDRGHSQWRCVSLLMDRIPAEDKAPEDRKNGQVQIPMRPHLVGSGFVKQTKRKGNNRDVGERDQERQASNAAELANLNEKPVRMLRNAEPVPAKSSE